MTSSSGPIPIGVLVLPEAGVDPRPAFLSAAQCTPRYYAQIRVEARTAEAARGYLPDDVSVIVAESVEDAVAQAVARCDGRAVLIMNAGEIVTRIDESREAAPASHARGLEASEYAISDAALCVALAGGVVERARWFPRREPRIATQGGAAVAAPTATLERRGPEIGDLLRALSEAALDYDAPLRRAGGFRLLGEPAFRAARVFFAGAWRAGFRGFLFASLHGLFWLIVLSRSWLRGQPHVGSAAG